jgi:hypothetical protein
MLNVSRSGKLNLQELRVLLNTLDVQVENEDQLRRFMEAIDMDGDGLIGYEEMRYAMLQQTYNGMQSGRHYVALSLEEAETVRGIIHKTQGRPVVADGQVALGLHYGPIMLDTSRGFVAGPPSQ